VVCDDLVQTDSIIFTRSWPGYDVGCLPLPNMGAFKCWGQTIFRNTVQHPSTSEPLSTPPMCPDYAQWDVSPTLKDDVRWALRSTFGEDKSQRNMENHRICWFVTWHGFENGITDSLPGTQ
jgi:hypothetical protein